MRIGWDSEHIYAVEDARAVERAGGKAASVHGRTREQLYTGKANWDIIKEVKEAAGIPVIGNGGLFSPEVSILHMDLLVALKNEAVAVREIRKHLAWLVPQRPSGRSAGEGCYMGKLDAIPWQPSWTTMFEHWKRKKIELQNAGAATNSA